MTLPNSSRDSYNKQYFSPKTVIRTTSLERLYHLIKWSYKRNQEKTGWSLNLSEKALSTRRLISIGFETNRTHFQEGVKDIHPKNKILGKQYLGGQ